MTLPGTNPYWSSSSIPRLQGFDEGHARSVHLNGGYVGLRLKSIPNYVWPVRGGL